MKNPPNDVVEYIETLDAHYCEFEVLTKQLAQLEFSTPEFESCVAKIRNKIAAIHGLESERGSLSELTKQNKTPRVQKLLDGLIAKIRRLADQYGQFESTARDTRSKLLPVVNQSIRFVKMKSAYNRYSS